MVEMADGIEIVAGESQVILCSPPGENRWGFYQFPDMWRAPNGFIFLAINVGSDSCIGSHEPSRFFVSRDNGASFQPCALDEVDQSPPIITFSDGSQVAFGASCYIYHVHTYGHRQPWQWWHTADFTEPPLADDIAIGYGNDDFAIYRHAAIPEAQRAVPTAWRASADAAWEQGTSAVEAPDLHHFAVSRSYWWDEAGNRVEHPMGSELLRAWPWNGHVVRMPDDTLVWACPGVNPASVVHKRLFFNVLLLASTDRGRTWHQRGVVASDTERTSDGYSAQEHSLQVMPNGDLLCVMRTEMGDKPDSSRFLAAARSSDGGFTWTAPEQIAPFSVTPLLVPLQNGTVALAYGRPGVYVRASADSGRHWTEALSVVGPPEAELLQSDWWKVRYDWRSDNKISCGNLGEVALGPDTFLLAYSDFGHRNAAGEQCKAVLVRPFTVRRAAAD